MRDAGIRNWELGIGNWGLGDPIGICWQPRYPPSPSSLIQIPDSQFLIPAFSYPNPTNRATASRALIPSFSSSRRAASLTRESTPVSYVERPSPMREL